MRLRVSSIDTSLTKVKLQDIFEEYGDIQSIKSFRLPDGSGNLALLLIEMKREREALEALQELNGKIFGSTALRVELSNDTIKTQGRKPVPPVDVDDDEDEDDAPSSVEAPDLGEDELNDEEEEVDEVPLDDISDEEY
ncbi:MAG: RNA-binding protein [Bacteroidetes bacterium]|nr:MAG: RNA-binding protein [Bacteroidota bacterium]